MCKRLSAAISRKQIKETFGNLKLPEDILKNYNISPGMQVYTITNETPQIVKQMQWGLIPFWASNMNSPDILYNARREGITSSVSFRIPVRQRRCLILTDSFYVWTKENNEKKPYRVTPKDGGICIMAGIWDRWNNNGNTKESCALVTTKASVELSEYTSRMPLILKDTDEAVFWLKEQNLNNLIQFMDEEKEDYLGVYRINETVNNPAFNSIDIHQRYIWSPSLFDSQTI
jgi:putative SOS response-associated peptidase YedK